MNTYTHFPRTQTSAYTYAAYTHTHIHTYTRTHTLTHTHACINISIQKLLIYSDECIQQTLTSDVDVTRWPYNYRTHNNKVNIRHKHLHIELNEEQEMKSNFGSDSQLTYNILYLIQFGHQYFWLGIVLVLTLYIGRCKRRSPIFTK